MCTAAFGFRGFSTVQVLENATIAILFGNKSLKTSKEEKKRRPQSSVLPSPGATTPLHAAVRLDAGREHRPPPPFSRQDLAAFATQSPSTSEHFSWVCESGVSPGSTPAPASPLQFLESDPSTEHEFPPFNKYRRVTWTSRMLGHRDPGRPRGLAAIPVLREPTVYGRGQTVQGLENLPLAVRSPPEDLPSSTGHQPLTGGPPCPSILFYLCSAHIVPRVFSRLTCWTGSSPGAETRMSHLRVSAPARPGFITCCWMTDYE
ncbi:cystin-1 isoform X1 [Mustela erminea]|uniref:cystin-1 isoform X1 n=1 Tax=Mustela erminea TaxID=36723 RepID=UPI00138725B0|nr:cystin-1 isoform X1 [Mustela erminea]